MSATRIRCRKDGTPTETVHYEVGEGLRRAFVCPQCGSVMAVEVPETAEETENGP